MEDVLTMEGQTVEIPPQSSGKLSIFPVLSLFSICPSLKSGTPTTTKSIFSKLTMKDLLSHQAYSLQVKNCGLREHLKLDDFDYIFTINGKKHLVVEWLSWSKDRPNAPRSLKMLEQRIHE